MKRTLWARVLAVLLVVCMVAPSVSAAGWGSWGSGSSTNGWGSWFLGLWDQIIGTIGGEEEEPVEEDQKLVLIEDATTVENGEMLRASTYALTTASEDGTDGASAAVMAASDDTDAQAEDTVLKYFPVTLYDYDATTINNATHAADLAADANLTEWQGIYFSGGSPEAESYTYTTSAGAHSDLTWAQVLNGTYYYDEAYTTRATVSPVTKSESGKGYVPTTVTGSYSKDFSSYANSTYYYQNDTSYELITGLTFTYSWWSSYWTIKTASGDHTSTGTSLTIYNYTETTVETTVGYKLTAGDTTLATLDGTDTSKTVGVTLYSQDKTSTTDSLAYADWNHWDKSNSKDQGNEGGQKTWTGLVESTLDANKDIVFTKPDGGIFDSNATVKSIYTNVEMPFVYEDGTYTFDASANGVYFHEDATQGSSGTAASNTRLYFNKGNTQAHTNMDYGDGSKTLWAPFNDGTSLAANAVNYYFGMRTTIPFTMTSNGRMDQSDDASEPIQFSFSGDDDVWVFIDGQLVVDLGGIHNRLDVTIDFAANTVTYSVSNDKKDEYETGSYNDENFALKQKLFNDTEETGLLGQDLATFAATDSHELTIFYLERGAGSSNCKIKFNLPMKDTVTVQKIVDGQVVVNEGGNTKVKDLSDLTADQLTALNNTEFTFTIYKNDTALANTTYNLLSANGQVIANPSTDANGKFVLKNGQTAKFVGEFSDSEDDTYYVVEDVKNGYIYTTYDATANAAQTTWTTANTVSHSYHKQTDNELYVVTNLDYAEGKLTSGRYSVCGGSEAEDSLAIVCKNYMNASLPRPSAIPADDKIVIDYGLSVVVDLFSNDMYLAEETEISFPDYTAVDGVYTAAYGTFTYDSATKTIIYQLNKQLTGVEVIEYTLTGIADTASATGTANIYIIPATTMYYEEDFADLVTYTEGSSSGWQKVGEADTDPQEPGVVGTVGDNPYGSDVAYLYDSGDSNGSSMYVDTTNGAAKFSYTFTGTGTSFYVRTTNNTGYLRIVVTDGEADQTIFRDTVYKNTGTLYNIPVFTTDGLDYGTYTVTVTVAKKNTNLGYNSEFWLDGIRVYQPLNEDDANYAVATGAYATDGEANMANVTLRHKLLCEADVDEEDNPVWKEGGNFVLFTDVDGELDTAEEYESIGPKEEVYLDEGQSVTFSLYDWDPNTNKIYLGIKAPFGSGKVTIGTKELTISNAADCYYDISSYGAVTTDADGIKTVTFTIESTDSLISLTNIKVTGNVQFTIVEGTNQEVSGSEGEG